MAETVAQLLDEVSRAKKRLALVKVSARSKSVQEYDSHVAISSHEADRWRKFLADKASFGLYGLLQESEERVTGDRRAAAIYRAGAVLDELERALRNAKSPTISPVSAAKVREHLAWAVRVITELERGA